jgi:hypothetical protein
MTDKQLLQAACAITGDPVEAVVDYRLAGDSLTVLIDRGIKGTLKFRYSLSQLVPPPSPVITVKPEAPVKPEPSPAPKQRRTRK